MAINFLSNQSVAGELTVSTIPQIGSDTDKFLMSASGVIKYVTGVNLRSYIGAGTSSTDNYVANTSWSSSTGVISLARTGTLPTLTIDIDGRYLLDTSDTFTGALTINGDIRGNAQELILNAGESYNFATSQTNEWVYVNAEQGLEINSSPDNWATGWAGRNITRLGKADGSSIFPGTINSGAITSTSTIGTSKIIMQNDGTLDWGSAKDYGTLTWDTGYAVMKGQSGKGVKIQINNSTTALTLDTSANATFVGDVIVSGGDITLGGTGRIQGIDTVSAGTDATNKTYVDNAIAGVPQGTVTGSGSSSRVAFWTSGSNIGSDGDFLWDQTNNILDTRSLLISNARVSTGEKYSPGHYTPGSTIWEIDPTWTDYQLTEFFNSTNVSWVADADAPGGYAINIVGGVSVGGVYGSGFPYIPIDDDGVYYMECYIKNVGTAQTHYMGSNEFDESFTDTGGNPGSYGYWTMSNTNPGSTWTKVSGYIGGFHSSQTGKFELASKYWTPMALFNYGAGSGTRACYISGWKAFRIDEPGIRYFDDSVGIGINSTPSSKLQVDGGIQMADDTDTAVAGKVGTVRYRTSGNNSYVDMCMQTAASTYEWINIVQNNW